MEANTYQNYQRSMVVSIIGRPNVGKSTIFNRLMRKAHKAITFDKPGVTRDRHYGITSFEELGDSRKGEAILVDTGGFYPQKIDENVPKKRDQVMNKFFNIMTEQARIAIRESDLILFVVDSREGVLPFDEIIADYIRSQKKEFWILINKFDSDKQEGEEFEFYSLGIDPDKMFKLSAEHGLGLLDLKQELHRRILKFEESEHNAYSPLSKGVTPREKVVARLAIIGAPNAGKSTLLNLLLGSDRALVSDIAGTTVDPIEGFFDIFFGKDAKRLEEDELSFAKNDNLLMQQYEDFRLNNPDVYQALSNVYNIEEENTGGNPIYEEEDLISDDIVEVDDNFEDVLSDEEFKKYDDEIYDEVFSEDDVNFDEEEIIEEPVEAKEEGSHWRSIHIVDTAGIRRQKAIEGFIEQQSVYRALRCITESDIIIYMIDASVGISHQDRRLLDIALDKGKSVIVCLNKIDLIKEKLVDEKTKKEWLTDLRETIPWLYYCDLIPISAKHGRQIGKLKDAIRKTVLIRNTSIKTGVLNRYVYQMLEQHSIGIKKAGKRLKIKYASMLKADPPTFLMFSNLSKDIPDNYKTYLKNGLRKEFNLANTPIHLIFRTGEDLSKRFQKRMKEIL